MNNMEWLEITKLIGGNDNNKKDYAKKCSLVDTKDSIEDRNKTYVKERDFTYDMEDEMYSNRNMELMRRNLRRIGYYSPVKVNTK